MNLKELLQQCDDETIPFIEKVLDDSTVYRVFSANTPEHLLKWHWDDEDRIVEVLTDSGWRFQFDNKIPQTLKRDDAINIKTNEFHRIIKGNGHLAIKITKIT